MQNRNEIKRIQLNSLPGNDDETVADAPFVSAKDHLNGLVKSSPKDQFGSLFSTMEVKTSQLASLLSKNEAIDKELKAKYGDVLAKKLE